MRVIIAGNISPDIVPVTNRGEIAEDLSVPEDRLHKPEIREVRAAVVGIIENEHIAIRNAAVTLYPLDHGLHRKGHHPDKDRKPRFALDKGFACLRVIDAVAGIMRLGNDRVEGGAEECCIHLVGDLFETAFENGKCHRIHFNRSHENSVR